MGWQVMGTGKKKTLTLPLPLNANAAWSSWIQTKRVLLTFLPRIREAVSPVNIALFSLLNLDTPGVHEEEEEEEGEEEEEVGIEDEDQGCAEDKGIKMPKVMFPPADVV
jgi:hypothetical protein